MAKYKVLEKCFLPSAKTGLRQYNVGEVIEYDGEAPECLEPFGTGSHKMESRKFDLPGYEQAPLLKRAETAHGIASLQNKPGVR